MTLSPDPVPTDARSGTGTDTSTTQDVARSRHNFKHAIERAASPGKIISGVRGYASAGLLGAAAIVFLAVGSPGKAALAGTGFAFVGAAVTRIIDLASQRKAASIAADAARRRDLDETRRLAYTLLAKRPSERSPELVGTVLNALVHHGLGVDFKVAMRYLTRIDEGKDSDAEAAHWLQAQIELLSQNLGEL